MRIFCSSRRAPLFLGRPLTAFGVRGEHLLDLTSNGLVSFGDE
jgi:hypothetical protein